MSLKWQKLKVLIAEDEEDLRNTIVMVFQRKGAQVFSACNGYEALEILNKEEINIVVSDVRMPKCDGVELLKTIRATHPDVPVVFLATGFADITEKLAKEYGAEDLIQKPFSISMLFSVIEKAVESNAYFNQFAA